MKKCPTCDKEFPDSMRFCQTDGTLLVEKVEDVDPYKTVVGNQDEIASAIPPLDPFKTMVASPPKKAEDDILQLPEEPDSLKTMVVSQDELYAKGDDKDDHAPLDLPPAPYAPSAPLIQPKPKASGSAPPPPKQDQPASAAPKLDDFSAPKNEGDFSSAPTAAANNSEMPIPSAPFESKPFENDFSSRSPYGNPDSKPIPSPFDLSMPPGYMPPSTNPFEDEKPKTPAFEASEPKPSASPFEASSPFGGSDPFSQNQPLQQAEWTPPPAPDASWQNQEIGANTPFQPPVAGSGQNKTLAIVSLVCGILSMVCCFSVITGPAGIITGFIAKNKADQNPTQFAGRGMALAGIITGALGTIIGILVIILQVLGAFAGRF